MTSFSKVPQNSFKVIYRDQTTIETSEILGICIFKRSDTILLFIQTSGIFYFFCDVIISKLGKKGPKLDIMHREW